MVDCTKERADVCVGTLAEELRVEIGQQGVDPPRWLVRTPDEAETP